MLMAVIVSSDMSWTQNRISSPPNILINPMTPYTYSSRVPPFLLFNQQLGNCEVLASPLVPLMQVGAF